MPDQLKIFRLTLVLVFLFSLNQRSLSQTEDSVFTNSDQSVSLPSLVPPDQYIECEPIAGGTEASPTSVTLEEAMQLRVSFHRDRLPADCGVQFISVTISIYNKQMMLIDKIVKHAFTFPHARNGESDQKVLSDLARKIVPFGFVSERKINHVMLLNDTVPGWTLIKIEVAPDEEYTKFAERLRYKMQWWYRVKGPQLEEEFFLGIPKVLYDSRSRDTITYGNASAMLRFYYLDAESGERYPFNLGIGTFGVSTPIDVSKNGGGFAVSLLFDVIQAVRIFYRLNITTKVNAGFEITPFFPLERKSRVLLNARIGYSP
jgi:hypothetical protein